MLGLERDLSRLGVHFGGGRTDTHELKSRFADFDFSLEICDSNFDFAVTIMVGSFKAINRHDLDFSFCSRSARIAEGMVP